MIFIPFSIDGLIISLTRFALFAEKSNASVKGSTVYSWLSKSSRMPSPSFEPPGSLTTLKFIDFFSR